MGNGSPGAIRRLVQEHPLLITGILIASLIILLFLFFVQWFLIQELFGFAADLVEKELINQAPDGVEASKIQTTFERVKKALAGMPLSYISGKINLKKFRAAAKYALNANDDEVWTAEEVNTVLTMMNAAVGYKREVE